MKVSLRICGFALLSVFTFTGCESTKSARSLDAPRLDPSPFRLLGRIEQIDPNASTAVVRLTRDLPSLPGTVYVRDTRLDIVALLKPTGIRTGLSVGMVIIQGKPTVGQEVYEKIDA